MKTYLQKHGSAANGHNGIGSGFDVDIVREDDNTAIAYIRTPGHDQRMMALLEVAEDEDLDDLAHSIASCPCESTYGLDCYSEYIDFDETDENEDYNDLDERYDAAMAEESSPLWEQLKAAIDDEEEEHAVRIAKEIKSDDIDLTFDDDEPYQTGDDIDDPLYVVRSYELNIKGNTVAEWTTCASGFYSSGRGNPNYFHGWNIEEDTDGGDGFSRTSDTLQAVIKVFNLTDDASEIPDVPEPEEPAECSEKEAEYCLMYRNPYSNQDEFESQSFYSDREEAEKALSAAYRDFEGANGTNAYGPEWAIGEKNEDGEWIVVDEEE